MSESHSGFIDHIESRYSDFLRKIKATTNAEYYKKELVEVFSRATGEIQIEGRRLTAEEKEMLARFVFEFRVGFAEVFEAMATGKLLKGEGDE